MRHFTLETIRALYGEPPDASEWASAEWEQRISRYREELEILRPKLPEKLAAYIDHGSLYEYHLERLTFFGGELDPVTQVRYSLDVELELSQGVEIRRLTYKNVKKILLDIDTNHTLLRSAAPSATLLTDTWLYDEISMLSPGVFRHEVLLASGGKFLIDFYDFSFFAQQNARTAEMEVSA